MRNGFPQPMARLLTATFVLALVALLGWLAYFASTLGDGPMDRFGITGTMWLTAALSGADSATSWALAFHHKFEGYSAGEEVLYRSCLIISTGILLCSGIWALASVLFG